VHYEKNFGEVRYSEGETGTKYRFQGQRSTEFDLYDFNARFFDARLGRFVQPDSVVPLASQGVQAWDRYAGLNNNPVRFNDPTGHMISCGDGEVGACGGDTPESIYFEKQQYESKCQNGNDNYCGHPVKGIAFGLAGAGLAAAGAAFVGGSGITASVAAAATSSTFTTISAGSDGAAGSVATTSTIVANRPNYPGIALPQSFTLTNTNYSFYVPQSGTKHMAEMLMQGPAGGTSMASEMVLQSLDDAVSAAVEQGITLGSKMTQGSWELIFVAPRESGNLFAIIHAVFISR